MWIYRTGKSYTDTPIILYEYQRTRKADHPEEFLKDFKGIVVCDGYSAYRKLDRENPDIVFAGCWSHARRRFAEALKALPKAAQKNAKETVEYSCAVTPQVRQTGNRLSGLAGTAYASLLT